MGSLSSLLTNPKDAYILGLWGADRYLRTSSIGLSNSNTRLLHAFLDYLLCRYSKDRIRVRVYGNSVDKSFRRFKISYCKGSKNRNTGYHLYVNSRPLVREFMYCLENRQRLYHDCTLAYFAGRFDGDGSIMKGDNYCRIVYGNLHELEKDRNLLPRFIKTSTYRYKKAGTYCLYFSKTTLQTFLNGIKPYSVSGKLS